MNDPETLRDIELYRQGDQEAAARLYARHAKLVLEVIRSKLPPPALRPHFGSEDVQQAAFKSFFSATKKPAFNLLQWNIVGLLIQIAKRKAFATFRPERRELPRAAGDWEYLVDVAATDLSEAEIQAITSDWQELLGQVVATLADWQREIMAQLLDDRQDATVEDVARRCGCDRVTVKLTITTFKAKLRRRLRRLKQDK